MTEKTNKPFSKPLIQSVDKETYSIDNPYLLQKEKFIDTVGELSKDLEIKLVMEACYEIADTIASLMDHTPEDGKKVLKLHPMNNIPQGLRSLAYAIETNKLKNNPKSDSLTWVYGTEVGCLGKPGMSVDLAAVYAVFDLNVGLSRMMKAALSQTPVNEETDY